MIKVTQIHPDDNVFVALSNLEQGEEIMFNHHHLVLPERVPAKHKFVIQALQPGDDIKMYGVLVGKAQKQIPEGGVITTSNISHATNGYRSEKDSCHGRNRILPNSKTKHSKDINVQMAKWVQQITG